MEQKVYRLMTGDLVVKSNTWVGEPDNFVLKYRLDKGILWLYSNVLEDKVMRLYRAEMSSSQLAQVVANISKFSGKKITDINLGVNIDIVD